MNPTDIILPSRRSFAFSELFASAISTPAQAGITWKLAHGSAEAAESDTSATTATFTTHANHNPLNRDPLFYFRKPNKKQNPTNTKIMKLPSHRHHALLLLWCAIAALCVIPFAGRATTIYQDTSAQNAVWQAENVFSITNSAPTSWVVTNDVPANGAAAIYQAGDNGTAFSSGFAVYAIKFQTPGSYRLYVRWRADVARSTQDQNGANSYRVPVDFGDLPTDAASLNFVSSSANNSRVPPAANNYDWIREAADTSLYIVTQAQVDAGQPLLFKIGTREWGMFLDRFVLSQNDGLTAPGLDALLDSPTDLIPQGPTENFIAFQAERASTITNSAPTSWVVTNDVPANGGLSIYQAGDNGTAFSSGFATYTLKFQTPGSYRLYVRWRADVARSTQDQNGANSYRVPVDFGDLPTDAASLNFVSSSANNSRVPPAANNYDWIREAADTSLYIVTQAQVDAGQPLLFKIGTREWGMFLDRFVLSQDDGLTAPGLDALVDSGSVSKPNILKAVGSASLTAATVFFDRALLASSIVASNFALSGGVTVSAATLNPNTSKDVVLTTSAQTAGNSYVVAVNNVSDVNSNSVSPNSQASFKAWNLSSGWAVRDLYFGVGTSVADLLANTNYPASPDAVEFIRSVSILDKLRIVNFGARVTTFFVPPQSGQYEFYLYADDDAQLFLSPNETEGGLAFALNSVAGLTAFDPSAVYTSGSLVAGQRYLMQVLFQQSTADARMAVGVRRVGDTTPLDQLPVLGGSSITTYVNPDAGNVTFSRQPTNTTAAAGGRARFEVRARATAGGLLFYQWQVGGVNIPGAIRPTYVTPALTAADHNKSYRCVVSVNGKDTLSQAGVLSVGPAQPSYVTPYIGINFVGGQEANPGGTLSVVDVAGVIPQENYNNLVGATFIDQPLLSATGATTPVLLSIDTGTTSATGVPETSADQALLQGYVHNANSALTITLKNVPQSNYNLIIYSVGFNFNATYDQSLSLAGAGTYPTYAVQAQHAAQYTANPAFTRMQSTNENARDLGNYTQFENVSPALDGTLVLVVTPQSTNTGVNFLPAVNGLQLLTTALPPPTLVVSAAGGNLTIGLDALAVGYTLEFSLTLGSGASWNPVSGVPNPITAAGAVIVPIAPGNRYFRLRGN